MWDDPPNGQEIRDDERAVLPLGRDTDEDNTTLDDEHEFDEGIGGGNEEPSARGEGRAWEALAVRHKDRPQSRGLFLPGWGEGAGEVGRSNRYVMKMDYDLCRSSFSRSLCPSHP
jgi:hypothetical protein